MQLYQLEYIKQCILYKFNFDQDISACEVELDSLPTVTLSSHSHYIFYFAEFIFSSAVQIWQIFPETNSLKHNLIHSYSFTSRKRSLCCCQLSPGRSYSCCSAISNRSAGSLRCSNLLVHVYISSSFTARLQPASSPASLSVYWIDKINEDVRCSLNCFSQ